MRQHCRIQQQEQRIIQLKADMISLLVIAKNHFAGQR